jgi:RHS repeat-associated protein
MKPSRPLVQLAILAAACTALFATYTYYFTDTLTTINTSNWTENGTLTAGSGGLTSSNSNGGSLISKVAVPDGSSNYEVKTTLTLTQSGGTYVTYLRASSNAMSGPAAAGTTYAFEVQNPTFSGSACSATLAGYRIVSAAVTALASTTIPCSNGMTVRAVYTALSNQIVVYVNNVLYYWIQDSTISSGKPGVGVRAAPSGNSIAEVQLGGIYTGAPTMPPTDQIGSSPFANYVELQWPGASEPNGPGVALYQLYRNGTYLANVGTDFIDLTVTHSTNYTYTIQALDFDLNVSSDSITVETPPTGAIDPRETGVRPTGSYWGGGGEQIDMLSGNLNYTMPLIKAMGRGGWSVGFNLTYNSQNWRQDPGGTWQLGQDVGYGYGWKLLAGSLLPYNFGYVFTDSTGAQYELNINNGGVWSSYQSIYVSFDSNTDLLHFNDGSYWYMGCISAGTEWDAGTMYPTGMEDSNGNIVGIAYEQGVGVTWSNSSSRISAIEDVRGNGSADYSFTYNTDAIPHLTGIFNNIGTAENYSFTYKEGYSLNSPFSGNPNFGTVALLASSTMTGIPLTTYFTYDTASATTSCSSPGTGTSGPGQLTQVTTPYCGHLRWTYTSTNELLGMRYYNEVQNRFLSMSSGAAETEIQLVRAPNNGDSGNTVHSSATLDDASSTANSEKYWTFETAAAFNLGLQLTYEERTLPSHTALLHEDFIWSQTPTTGNPYIGTTVTKLNPGQTYEADKATNQTLDQYGNLSAMQVSNFGTGAVGSLARTYTNAYLGGSNYTSRYIVNRLLSSTVTDGTNTATLVSNTYDTSVSNTNSTATCNPAQQYTTSICEHNTASYPYTFTYRGDLSSSVTPTTTTSQTFDMTGTVLSTWVNGVSSQITPTNNWAAPGQITTNTLTSTMTWSSFLGLSSATGPNGDTGSISYDGNARPYQTTSPYGAVTTYTYNDTASPPNKIATTDGHWVETEMDGFGRTIKTITGYGSTTVSTVDTQYAPCGCSPLGKLSKVSQPYAPGQSDYWTTYTYDASGRTTSIALQDTPNSTSTTTYSYTGTVVYSVDPAGIQKSFGMDAFGNLQYVWEIDPDPTPGTVVQTQYTYDVLNHLTGVSMPRGATTQTRTFNYNSLTSPTTVVTGFLQTAKNPENGTVTYTYNTNGTLASKTDAKNQQLTYQYDAYNRLTSVTWANNPRGTDVLRTYYYDTNPLQSGFSQNALGRLTAVQYPDPLNFFPGTDPVELVDMYSYTQAGLPATKRLQVNESLHYQDTHGYGHNTSGTVNLDSTYTYNSEGKIASITYPTTTNDAFLNFPGNSFNGSPNGLGTYPGASYNYSYDGMYRLSVMTTSSGTTVVNGVTYNAANQLQAMNYNGTSETRGYNVLNQLTNLYNSGGVNLTYNYPAGANNGKVSSTYNAISVETVIYTYDSLNRLFTANGSGWGQQYGFDSFGNLQSKTITAGSGPSLSMSVNPANNQIDGGNYDANGNLASTSSGSSVLYDVENRIFGAGGETYAYDAQNRRIFSWAGAMDYSGQGNPDQYQVALYSPSGQKLATYQIDVVAIGPAGTALTGIVSTLISSDQYFGGRRLATMDQLGSVGTFYPWGEAKGSTNPQNTWSYATYWRDSGTNLDYAHNRYYSNAYGRFMTPDPSASSESPNNPQSWNRYPYVLGDPVNGTDPTGLDEDDPGVCDFDPFLAECGGASDPYGGTALPPSSSYPPAPTSISVPITGASGAAGYFSVNTAGTATFQFGYLQLTVPTSALTTLPAPPSSGYWAYFNCFWTGMLTATVNQPEIPGVSLLAMFSGLITGAAWGPGAVVVGGITITVDLFNKENQVARGCAKLTGYTPWILQ